MNFKKNDNFYVLQILRAIVPLMILFAESQRFINKLRAYCIDLLN